MINSIVDKMQKKEILLEKVFRLAFDFEKEKCNCSQCAVAALQDVFKIKSEEIFSASYALEGGLADTCEGTCGALAGGAMIISYFYGRRREEFFKNILNEKASYLTRKLHDRFIQEYGSCLCKDIQKKIFGRSFNLLDEKEIKLFVKSGGHIDKCPSVVAKGAKWAAEIIWNEQQK